jgi:hypothetical protein
VFYSDEIRILSLSHPKAIKLTRKNKPSLTNEEEKNSSVHANEGKASTSKAFVTSIFFVILQHKKVAK